MTSADSILLVLVDAAPLRDSAQALVSAGEASVTAVRFGDRASTCFLLKADDLGRIDSHLERWLHTTAETLTSLRQRHATLTPREREALPLIAAGLLNKQAASMLRISEATLQIHRGPIMRKMAASSFAQLVRMAHTLGIEAEALNAPHASIEAAV